VKAGGIYLPADMICQFRVRTCADRTGATGALLLLNAILILQTSGVPIPGLPA
jgi:hypothetical protein